MMRFPCGWCSVRVRTVGGVLFYRDQLLQVKVLPVRAAAHFIHNRWLKMDEDRARSILSCTCTRDESVERVVTFTDGLVARRLNVKQDAMFETGQLPTCVADLVN